MKNLIKILTSILFSLELILPSMALAKSTPMPSPYKMDQAPVALKKRISTQFARDIFRRYQAVKTAKDFDNLFLKKLSAKDRKEVLEKKFPIQEYPSMAISGDVLTLKWTHYTLTLQVSEVWNNKLRINGKDWVYSDRVPAIKNVENLENFLAKLEKQGSRDHVMWRLIVPEANAIAPVAMWAAALIGAGLLGMITTGAGTTAMDNVCAYMKEQKNVDLRDWYIGGCKNYFDIRDAKAKSLTNATSVMDVDQLNDLLDKFEIEAIKCPEKGKKDFSIKTRMRRSETNAENIVQAPLPAGNLLSTKSEPFITGTTPISSAVPEVKDGVLVAKDQAPPLPPVGSVSTVPVAETKPTPTPAPTAVTPAPSSVTKESLRAWSRVDMTVKEGKVESMTIGSDEPEDPKMPDKNVVCRVNFNPDGSVKTLAIRNRLFDPKDPSSKPVLEYSAMSVYNRTHEAESSSESEADLTARQQNAMEMSKYLNQRIMNDSLRECRKNQKIDSDGKPASGSDKASDFSSSSKSGSK